MNIQTIHPDVALSLAEAAWARADAIADALEAASSSIQPLRSASGFSNEALAMLAAITRNIDQLRQRLFDVRREAARLATISNRLGRLAEAA